MKRNLHPREINSEEELVAIVNEVGIKRIISMYAWTTKASPIDGEGWEALDYVYLNLSDLDRGDEWTTFNKKYAPNPTLDDLKSHFKILQGKKLYDKKVTINIL